MILPPISPPQYNSHIYEPKNIIKNNKNKYRKQSDSSNCSNCNINPCINTTTQSNKPLKCEINSSDDTHDLIRITKFEDVDSDSDSDL